MLKSISKSLQGERLESFRTQNNKLFNLTKRREKEKVDYKVLIINLSNNQWNEKEYDQLKIGLNHCLINRDKNIKKHIAANMESIVYIASEKVDQNDLENFHEFLWGCTDVFAKNVISTEDHTYQELKTLIHNKDVVILKGDKDSSIVIMNKTNYIKKIGTLIGIKNGTYAETDHTTMQDLKWFQDFLCRNFKSMNITMKCILKVMSWQKCTARQKLTNLVVQISN